MGNIGDNITQPIPAVGTVGTTYATQVDAFLTEVKTRLEARVPMASLLIGQLDMSNNSIINIGYLHLQGQGSTPSTPTGSIQQYLGELYWVGTSGVVKITNGTSVNVTGIAGITGDYGGVNPAQFRFVDADQEYYAYDDFGGGAWAKLWARHFDIAGGATSAVRCRLQYGGAGSYTLSMPTALPGSGTKVVTLDSTGLLATGTTPDTLTFGANQNVVLSGTGVYKHGTKTRVLPLGLRSVYQVAAGGGLSDAAGQAGVILANNSTIYFSLPPMATHERVVGVKVYFNSAADRTACTCVLYQTSSADPQTTTFTSTGVILTNTGTAISQTGAISLTPTGAQSYFVQVSNSVTTPKIQSITVDYDV